MSEMLMDMSKRKSGEGMPAGLTEEGGAGLQT